MAVPSCRATWPLMKEPRLSPALMPVVSAVNERIVAASQLG